LVAAPEPETLERGREPLYGPPDPFGSGRFVHGARVPGAEECLRSPPARTYTPPIVSPLHRGGREWVEGRRGSKTENQAGPASQGGSRNLVPPGRTAVRMPRLRIRSDSRRLATDGSGRRLDPGVPPLPPRVR